MHRATVTPLAVLALLALPLIGSPSTWLTLTIAGLAMGMIVFVTASGLTLVFGLMDVLNFGHGVFIAFGAYVATTVFAGMADWTPVDSLLRNLVAVFAAMAAAMALAGAIGWAFERVMVRPVYGQHLKQILITMGGMIIGEELIKVIWGPEQRPLPLPEALRGSLLVGDAAIIVESALVGIAIALDEPGRFGDLAREVDTERRGGGDLSQPAFDLGLLLDKAERPRSPPPEAGDKS